MTAPKHLADLPTGPGPFPALVFVYRFAASAGGPVRVDVISGGHDLGGETGAELAARLVADFLASYNSP